MGIRIFYFHFGSLMIHILPNHEKTEPKFCSPVVETSFYLILGKYVAWIKVPSPRQRIILLSKRSLFATVVQLIFVLININVKVLHTFYLFFPYSICLSSSVFNSLVCNSIPVFKSNYKVSRITIQIFPIYKLTLSILIFYPYLKKAGLVSRKIVLS